MPFMPRPKPNLSIVIPAFKEEETISETIDELRTFLKSRHQAYGDSEVIIAVGNSPDDTLKVALEATKNDDNFKIIDAGSPSDKGHNVRVGMSHAQGDKRVYMDADLATPLHNLDAAVMHLDQYDVVNGQRDLSSIHNEQGHRKFISKLGNMLVQRVLLPGFKDTQCGFKGFRESMAEKLFPQQKINRWGFDIEILALAQYNNARIKQLPVKDWKDVAGGVINESRVKAFKAAFMTLGDLVKIRYGFYRGQYTDSSRA